MRTLVTTAGLVFVSLPAFASPMAMRIQEAQFRRFENGLKGTVLHVQRDLVEQEGVACFDPVGVRNLDLQTQVSELTLTPAAAGGRLDVVITLDQVNVRGTVFAEGGFPCFEVEALLDPLTLDDVRLSASVAVSTTPAGELVLEVIETGAIVGAITITGSPTLAELEDDFGVISSMLPSLLDLAASQAVTIANEQIELLRVSTLMGVPYRVSFTNAQVGATGIDLAASIEIGLAEKAACLAADANPPVLTSAVTSAPALPASFSPDSGVVLSMAADLPDRALGAAWWAGLLCGEMTLTPAEELAETLELLTGKSSGEITVRYVLSQLPRITLEGDRVRVEVEKAHVEILDASQMLFLADVDLNVAGTARIDPETRLVLGNVEQAQVLVGRLESALANGEEGREEMKRFIQENLPLQVIEGMRDTPVADGVFRHSLGRLLLEIVRAEDGILAAASPYLESDPDVDPSAPETSIAGPFEHGWDKREFELFAIDDRAGTLVYSWSLDGGPWSPWSRDTKVVAPVAPGEHQIIAISRDRWGNVDESPAVLDFTAADSTSAPGCACSTTAGSPSRPFLPIALTALAVVLVRRRRALAMAPALVVLALPLAAHADDTRVMPPGHFIISMNTVYVLNNPPADVTGSSVDIPTGVFPIGIDATAREQHKMQAKLLVPTAVVGVYRNLNVIAYLPIFLDAQVDVQEFEVQAAGVDVTPQAQQALREAGFRGAKKKNRDQPISDWRDRGIGDLGVMLRWRAYGDRKQALSIMGGVKAPTGKREDPLILTDFGFGEGQWDLSADVAGERRLEPIVLGANAGYKLKLPGEAPMRPVGGPTVHAVRDPGDVMNAGLSVRGSGAKMSWFGFSGGAKVEHHLADTNIAGIETPDQRGTALVVSGGVGLSNVRWFLKHYKRGRIMGLPMMLNIGAQQSIPLTGNRNLEVFQATARLDFLL